MRKLHIINHKLMPEVKKCSFNITSDEYYCYIMNSRSKSLYYEIMIKPFKDGKNVILRDVETLEDLIMTNAEYFCIRLVDLDSMVIDTLYENLKEYPNFYLN